MDINWFDNYEEDGQLSLFSVGEDIEDLRESEPKEKNIPENGKEVIPSSGSAGIRIQRCSSCGKLLFVKTEEDCYRAVCNACNIQYMQKR